MLFRSRDIKADWKEGTIQGKSEAVGRTASVTLPFLGVISKITKATGTAGKLTGTAAREAAERAAQEAAERAAQEAAERAAQEAAERTAQETTERAGKEVSQEVAERARKTDNSIPVKRGDSSTNGSGVKISGEKPKTDVGEIKTTKVEGNKLEESVTQTGDVLAQTEIKSNINNATKYELTDRLKLHIEMVDTSVPRKRGIGGAHKRDVFIQNDIRIISETPHPNIDGVSKIEYQMPKRDKTGVPILGEYQDGVPKVKTVYDSNIISTDEYLRRGLEAANNAASQYENGILPREWVGVDNNGVLWRGYCKNGEITSMYPE